MLKDVNYDIIQMIAENSKALSRIDTYKKDSSDCNPCQNIWNKIRDNREQELDMLMNQLKQHVESGAHSREQRAA